MTGSKDPGRKSRRAEIKGVNVMRFPSAESKISWGKVARCCFELPSLTGDRQIPIVFGGPGVSCPGGPIFPLLHASSRTKDVSGQHEPDRIACFRQPMQWASQTRVLCIDLTIGLSPTPATSGTCQRHACSLPVS